MLARGPRAHSPGRMIGLASGRPPVRSARTPSVKPGGQHGAPDPGPPSGPGPRAQVGRVPGFLAGFEQEIGSRGWSLGARPHTAVEAARHGAIPPHIRPTEGGRATSRRPLIQMAAHSSGLRRLVSPQGNSTEGIRIRLRGHRRSIAITLRLRSLPRAAKEAPLQGIDEADPRSEARAAFERSRVAQPPSARPEPLSREGIRRPAIIGQRSVATRTCSCSARGMSRRRSTY